MAELNINKIKYELFAKLATPENLGALKKTKNIVDEFLDNMNIKWHSEIECHNTLARFYKDILEVLNVQLPEYPLGLVIYINSPNLKEPLPFYVGDDTIINTLLFAAKCSGQLKRLPRLTYEVESREVPRQPLVILRERIKEIPFDKYSEGVGFIHSTGDRCLFDDGHWEFEWEDNIFANAPDCEYVLEGELEIEEVQSEDSDCIILE